MRLLRLMVAFGALAAAVSAQPVAVAPDSLGVPELMAQFKVPAVSVAVIRDFEIEWARAWGVKDAASGEAATVTRCSRRRRSASRSRPWRRFAPSRTDASRSIRTSTPS